MSRHVKIEAGLAEPKAAVIRHCVIMQKHIVLKQNKEINFGNTVEAA